MKMTRRDFLNVSTAAAVVCAATPFARRESRSRTADAGCTEPSGAGVSVRLSAGDHGCYADGFHKHPHSYKQQGPINQFIHAEKLADANDPCGGYAECGYHLYAGVFWMSAQNQ
mgnify:CR=1 FL=1